MTTTADATTIVKEITIDARAAKVFAALTDPAQLPQWWGEEGKYKVDRMESDLRPGGKWGAYGTSSDGSAFSVEGVYRIVDAPHLVEMTWKHDWEESAEETVVRYDLTETNGTTLLRVTHSGFVSPKSRDEHAKGWEQVLAWLAAFIAPRAS
jgi:uncharacterized protein YndB with AHSA1/START domain